LGDWVRWWLGMVLTFRALGLPVKS